MPGNSFIKFDGVPVGESFQENFSGKDGWIEIGDWSWDVEAESSFMKGGGAAVGKATPGALSFSHYFDKSSPQILRNIVKGVHFATVDIVMCKQTGKHDLPQEYFRITLKSAFTTKVSTKGGEDGAVAQDVEMVAKDIHIKYKAQDNQGNLADAGEFQWDIAGNKLLK
ncbi:MAG TPA: type VI secretion system tube protein Hcp [Candidatus Aquabacterium excrementipullorum]|nr:type VI secretion system tube protein Hcp [Candidatus Aquabacterium excrementipullorum]